MGFLGHAFILAFYYLLRYNKKEPKTNDNEYYYLAIRETIRLGGDTDTNACIVGGMIGALVGIHSIPDPMLDKLLEFDCIK